MITYWWMIVKRSIGGSCRVVFGSWVAFCVSLFVGAFSSVVAFLCVRGKEASLVDFALSLVGFPVAAVCVFLYHLVSVPARMDSEIRLELDDIRKRITPKIEILPNVHVSQSDDLRDKEVFVDVLNLSALPITVTFCVGLQDLRGSYSQDGVTQSIGGGQCTGFRVFLLSKERGDVAELYLYCGDRLLMKCPSKLMQITVSVFTVSAPTVWRRFEVKAVGFEVSCSTLDDSCLNSNPDTTNPPLTSA